MSSNKAGASVTKFPRSPLSAQRRAKKLAPEVAKWAAIEVVPWDNSDELGPSREQWVAWQNPHAVMLRVACHVMTLSKEQLAEAAGKYESNGKGGLDEILEYLETSRAFFNDMANIVEGAKTRLLIGSAVYAQQAAASVQSS
jgi:hypothetical protein